MRYTVKDVNPHFHFSLRHFSCPYSAPQGWSIISLNLLEPILILLEACRLSVSFSLASFKGSLSSLFPFHCLLPAHQAGQLQPVIWSQCVSERGSHTHCSRFARPKESEKCYLDVRGHATRVEGSNRSSDRSARCHSASTEINFSKFCTWLVGLGFQAAI